MYITFVFNFAYRSVELCLKPNSSNQHISSPVGAPNLKSLVTLFVYFLECAHGILYSSMFAVAGTTLATSIEHPMLVLPQSY